MKVFRLSMWHHRGISSQTSTSHLRPLLRCVLLVLRLASRWDRLEACKATVCSQLILSLATQISFPEREESPTLLSLGSTQVSFLKYWYSAIISIPSASQLASQGLKYLWNLIWQSFLDRQIKNLTKFSGYMVALLTSVAAFCGRSDGKLTSARSTCQI